MHNTDWTIATIDKMINVGKTIIYARGVVSIVDYNELFGFAPDDRGVKVVC